MDEDESKALHDALAVEIRLAQAAQRLSAPKLEEMTGLQRDTIRRIANGDRPVTVVELARLGSALKFNELDLIDLAKARARAGMATSEHSVRLREKLELLASSVGKTTDTIYQDVAEHLGKQGFHFPRKIWNELLSDSDTQARREVLFAISGAFDVDPRYLTTDSTDVDRVVEARLRFHRVMNDLGVEEVSAHALEQVSPDELDILRAATAEAVQERMRRKPVSQAPAHPKD
ncbi:transcriptional regulator with XRE-family HTH domain [Arthrobacter sp. GAS37]|uniref:hypothetical protein n=1 Tax=Arthrobacter sp. GAS37 TaxID=3156261 RepID=UPI0038364927